MLKALFKLCFLVILPVTYLLASQSYNPLQVYNDWLQESISEQLFKGVFKEIENQIMELDEPQRKAKFEQIALNFKADLKLEKIEDIVQDERKRVRLRKGEFVALGNQQGSVALRVSDTDWVIALASEQTLAQDTYHIASGPIYLFQKALEEIPEVEYARYLPELEARFSWEINLLSDAQFAALNDSKVLHHHAGLKWVMDDNEDEVFIVETQTGELLTVAPIRNQLLITSSLVVPFVLVLLFICTGLMLWLWPLWKDHKMLTTTAKKFGTGYLDARVRIRKGAFSNELAKSFNRMADNIQNLVQVNQSLTNAVAHDLRTPMARLRFANNILESSTCSDEEAQRYRNTINSSIDSLDYLISQTLHYSRYNRSTDINHFANCNFAAEILEEVDQYQFDYDGFRFETDIEASLLKSQQFVDARALKRALGNLLSNAAKHAKSYILISYFQQDNRFAFRIEDDGAGIDEEHYKDIFQPYKQLANQERKLSEGVGLGLAIVEQIARWHNGEVHLQRSDLGGACFTLSWVDARVGSG